MCSTLTPVYGLPQYSTLRLWQDGKSCGSRDALSALNGHGLIIVNFPSCHTSTVLPVITGQTRSLLSSRACSGDGKGIALDYIQEMFISSIGKQCSPPIYNSFVFTHALLSIHSFSPHTPGEPRRLCYYQGKPGKASTFPTSYFFFSLFSGQRWFFWSPLGTSVTVGIPIRIKSPNRIKVSECKRHE